MCTYLHCVTIDCLLLCHVPTYIRSPDYKKAVKLSLDPSSTVEDVIGKALGYIELEVQLHCSPCMASLPNLHTVLYMCTHTYVHTYIHAYTYVCTYVHTHMYTYVHIHTHTYVHVW